MYTATLKQQNPKLFLAATNLALRDRPDPDKRTVQRNHYYSNDPEDLRVVCLVVAEDDGKDDAAKVSGGTDNAGENTLRELAAGL